jgi:hypothetical protein
MSSPPDTLQPREELGRAIFDSKHAKNAKRGVVPPKVFLEKPGESELSVDRLGYANLRLAANAQTQLRQRDCRGWATLLLEAAANNGRQVLPDPILPDRLYHAFILLPFDPPPSNPEQAFVVQNTHAVELAMSASWREAPPKAAATSEDQQTK